MIEDIFNNSKPKNKIYTSKIIIDTREKNSLVPVYLIKKSLIKKKN